jgi:hypothetical protein
MIRDPQSAEDLRDQPVGELFQKFSEEASRLARQEIALAKAELVEKAKSGGIGLGLMGTAYVFGRLMIATGTAAAILGLAVVVPAWLAALIVTGVWGLVAIALVFAGTRRLKAATPPVPTRAIASVKEDVEWLKSRTRSART